MTAPEEMVGAFERLHRMRVTVHDVAGVLSGGLSSGRIGHADARCRAVKAAGHQAICSAFDVERLRSEVGHLPEGRIHVCPAGLVEWVVPVLREGRLLFIVFAGVRLPGDLPGIVRARRQVDQSLSAPTVDLDEASDLLEALRQLAARLRAWIAEHRAAATGTEAASTTRLSRIMSFIDLHHREELPLSRLARELGLSPVRASREVRRLTGRTFVDLLREARLGTAVDLLCHSDLPIGSVAMRSGFTDESHFHRHFRERFGRTPRAMRIRERGP